MTMKKNRLLRSTFAAAALGLAAVCASSGAWAQTTGGITGTVFDSKSHAKIAGAHVSFISTTAQEATTTSKDGSFSLLSLGSGLGRLIVAAKGYRVAVIIRCVHAGAVEKLDIPMFNGQASSHIDATTFYNTTFAPSKVEPGESADRYSVGPC